jgi:hypothetical protein
MLRFAIKLCLSVLVILLATQIGRKMPTLAGLIAVMPLTSLIVLLWLYSDHPGDVPLLVGYCEGALLGTRADDPLFRYGSIVFSPAPALMGGARRRLRSLAGRGLRPSVASPQILTLRLLGQRRPRVPIHVHASLCGCQRGACGTPWHAVDCACRWHGTLSAASGRAWER